jgi:hypothetical protein
MSTQPSTNQDQTSPSGARGSRDGTFDDDSLLIDFFDRLGTALSSGDARAVAASWAAPALVVGHEGIVHAVSSRDEVETFFAGAREQYLSRGISSTRAEIVRVNWLSPRTALAEVRWPMLDANQRELGEERTTYTLLTNDDGELEIRVAVTHGEATH